MNDERQWERGWRPVMVGLALVTASAGVWAAGPSHGVGGPMGPMEGAGERMVEHWMRGLDLHPAQREQLQTLAQAARADMQPRARKAARCARSASACWPRQPWTKPRWRHCASANWPGTTA